MRVFIETRKLRNVFKKGDEIVLRKDWDEDNPKERGYYFPPEYRKKGEGMPIDTSTLDPEEPLQSLDEAWEKGEIIEEARLIRSDHKEDLN